MPEPFYRLALCFRDKPIALDQAPAGIPLSERVEQRCRETGAVCVVDTLNLRPERSLKSLMRPMPRTQDLVTTVWPDEAALRESLGADGLLEEVREAPHVVFWVPGPYIPGMQAVEKRLARKELIGGSGLLGDLRAMPAPPEPPASLGHPAREEMEAHENRLRANPELGALQYDRRVFRSAENTSNGDVQPGLEFQYHESSGVVWAFYEGEGVELGTLAARKDAHGRLRMAYQHLNNTDQLREGWCFSYPEMLPDGYLRMHEYWRWTSGDASAGQSLLEEKRGVTVERKIS